MSAGDAIPALHATIADLHSQIKDFRRDKEDLRTDKDALKADAARLKEDLQMAMSEIVRLGNEVRVLTTQNEDLKKEKNDPAKNNAVKRCEASAQTNDDAGTIHSRPAPRKVNEKPVVGDEALARDLKGGDETHSDPIEEAKETTSIDHEQSQGKRKVGDLEDVPQNEVPSKRGRPRKSGAMAIKLPVVSSAADLEPLNALTRLESQPARVTRASEAEANVTALAVEPGQTRPEIEFKVNEGFLLPAHDLAWRLEGTLASTETFPLGVGVSRDFLAREYGGSHCQSIQYVKAEKNPSGDIARAFAFPRPDLNPQMPHSPGESGVVVGNHCERAVGQPVMGLFSSFGTEKVYVGEYSWERGEGMGAEVFRGQTEPVKKSWAAGVLGEKRTFGEAQISQRARIALRKAGFLPQDTKGLEDEVIRQELERIKMGRGYPVEERDVIGAFERGEEAVPVTRLRFVSYDATLAADIEARLRESQRSKGNSKRRAGTKYKKVRMPTTKAQKPGSFTAFSEEMMGSVIVAHLEPGPSSVGTHPVQVLFDMKEGDDPALLDGAGLSYMHEGAVQPEPLNLGRY